MMPVLSQRSKTLQIPEADLKSYYYVMLLAQARVEGGADRRQQKRVWAKAGGPRAQGSLHAETSPGQI